MPFGLVGSAQARVFYNCFFGLLNLGYNLHNLVLGKIDKLFIIHFIKSPCDRIVELMQHPFCTLFLQIAKLVI
jgi:hypothetical protein